MTNFSRASQFAHGQAPKTAVLLIQLGTPETPEPGAVKRYLREFLSDPRVVEIPKLIWFLILNLIILNLRPRKSAQKYQSIWTKEGSPLAVNSRKQAVLLQGYLGEQGIHAKVALAMRYGQPSIASVLEQLREEGLTKLLVLPMYPQYAGSTTATALDEVFRVLSGWRNMPELRIIRSFQRDPGYIQALADKVRKHRQAIDPAAPKSSLLMMSFHGVPERTLHLGDPYHCECYVTARLLGEALGLSKDQLQVSFQSRFGKAKWLEPYTDATLKGLPAKGHEHIDVICPGFVVDCLETLEEIAMEGKEAFEHAGGKSYRYIPCLNDDHAFIQALAALSAGHLRGWADSEPSAEVRAAQARRAKEMGASL